MYLEHKICGARDIEQMGFYASMYSSSTYNTTQIFYPSFYYPTQLMPNTIPLYHSPKISIYLLLKLKYRD